MIVNAMISEETKQDYYLGGYDAGIEEGIEKGVESTLVSSIRNMMSKLKLSAEEAMDTLDIPKSERSKYMTML